MLTFALALREKGIPVPEIAKKLTIKTGVNAARAPRSPRSTVSWPPLAKSDCSYYCPDAVTAERCIQALRESDERLRSRPEEQMLWDWECTYFEAKPGNPNGGGTVILDVAWFDQAFFDDRRDAWFGAMHTRIYQTLGIPLDDITVTHWTALAS